VLNGHCFRTIVAPASRWRFLQVLEIGKIAGKMPAPQNPFASIILENPSVFHHKVNFAHGLNVVQLIFRSDDDVGSDARPDRAALRVDAKQARCTDGHRPQCVLRGLLVEQGDETNRSLGEGEKTQ